MNHVYCVRVLVQPDFKIDAIPRSAPVPSAAPNLPTILSDAKEAAREEDTTARAVLDLGLEPTPKKTRH